MRSFLLKVNGVAHCPRGISNPKDGDWDGGSIEISKFGPIRAEPGKMQLAGEIKAGDELWIWTHETRQHGAGVGLCARAHCSATFERDGKTYVTLGQVMTLNRKIGRSTFRGLGLPSRVISYTLSSSHNRVYLLEGDDRDELIALLALRDQEELAGLGAQEEKDDGVDWLSELRDREANQGLLAARDYRTIAARPEQSKFRKGVFARYEQCCLVTGCRVPSAIEAAHVVPHDGRQIWDLPQNGIPLRRDLHGMYDDFLWSIDPISDRFVLSDTLRDMLPEGDEYLQIEGMTLPHKVPRPLLEWRFLLFTKVGSNEDQCASRQSYRRLQA